MRSFVETVSELRWIPDLVSPNVYSPSPLWSAWLPKAVRPPASNSSRFHAKLVLPSLPAKFSLPPHTVGTARAEAVFCGLVLKTNPLPELPNAPTLEALDEQSGIAQSSSCTNGHGIPILPIG